MSYWEGAPVVSHQVVVSNVNDRHGDVDRHSRVLHDGDRVCGRSPTVERDVAEDQCHRESRRHMPSYHAQAPVTEMQKEVVLIPTVANHHRHHHVEQDAIVEFNVPREQEDIIHVPKIIPPGRLIHQAVEQIAQVPMITKVQMTAEVPQIKYVDHHTHVPVRKHCHVPMVTVAQMIAHVPSPRARRDEVVYQCHHIPSLVSSGLW
jgi:hypothetical protein